MLRHTTPLIVIALLVCACFTASPSPTSVPPSPSAQPAARPIIVDADLDHSDIAALLVLLRDPALDIRAITIAGTGLVHCAGGRTVLRYLLEEMGAIDIPFGCGRQHGGLDARPFPDDWRAVADSGYGLELTPRVETTTPPTAVEVMIAAIAGSPEPPLLVTLGPLTNLEDAFAADPSVVDHVTGVHAMLGSIDAPGNVYFDGHTEADPLEWNAFADPSAVDAVIATDLPITLIPLDATRDVPIPTDLANRLADDHAGAGADLLYELLVRHPARLRADEGQQLWDELAALTVTGPELVTWADATVVVGDGGRLTRDPAGRPVRFGSGADRPAVETALLAGLRRGAPRITPFAFAGNLTVAWDGATCEMSGEPTDPGLYVIRFENGTRASAGATFIRVEPPHQWSEIEALLADFDPATFEEPAWATVTGSAGDEEGTGVPRTFTAELGAGVTHGAICLAGKWPDLDLFAASPFEIGG